MIVFRGFRSSIRLSNKKDFYKILGVSSIASSSDIKKAYFELAKKYHPDVNKSFDAKAKFAEINSAYETLADDEKRKSYDQTGMTGDEQEQAKTSGFNTGNFSGFSPFSGFTSSGFSGGFTGFQDFFSEFGDVLGAERRGRVIHGGDISVAIEISFLEAANGCTKTIQLDRKTLCVTCNGTKIKPGSSATNCDLCAGQGFNIFQSGFMSIQTTCQKCQGSGKIVNHFCSTCKGSGSVDERTSEIINIPPGINNGHAIRMSHRGNVADSAALPGDLLIKFIVKPHPIFKRESFDIHSEVPLTVSQAALGAMIEVETLTGKVKIQVEPGTNPGDTVKLAHKGIVNLPPNNQKKGDHYIKFTIKIPKSLTREEKKLFEELAKRESEKS